MANPDGTVWLIILTGGPIQQVVASGYPDATHVSSQRWDGVGGGSIVDDALVTANKLTGVAGPGPNSPWLKTLGTEFYCILRPAIPLFLFEWFQLPGGVFVAAGLDGTSGSLIGVGDVLFGGNHLIVQH